MKLYDKTDNGTMVFAELQHILMALGNFFG
jgi:hypothetical protein